MTGLDIQIRIFIDLTGIGPSLSQTRGALELSCVTNFLDKKVTTSPIVIVYIAVSLIIGLAWCGELLS